MLTRQLLQEKGNSAFPVFILITYQEINIKSFSVCMNLGKQKSTDGTPPGLFCFPMGMQKSPSDFKLSTCM